MLELAGVTVDPAVSRLSPDDTKPLLNEALTVAAVKLTSSSRLAIMSGLLPKRGELVLRHAPTAKGVVVKDSVIGELAVKPSITAAALREAIAEARQLDKDAIRLKRAKEFLDEDAALDKQTPPVGMFDMVHVETVDVHPAHMLTVKLVVVRPELDTRFKAIVRDLDLEDREQRGEGDVDAETQAAIDAAEAVATAADEAAGGGKGSKKDKKEDDKKDAKAQKKDKKAQEKAEREAEAAMLEAQDALILAHEPPAYLVPSPQSVEELQPFQVDRTATTVLQLKAKVREVVAALGLSAKSPGHVRLSLLKDSLQPLRVLKADETLLAALKLDTAARLLVEILPEAESPGVAETLLLVSMRVVRAVPPPRLDFATGKPAAAAAAAGSAAGGKGATGAGVVASALSSLTSAFAALTVGESKSPAGPRSPLDDQPVPATCASKAYRCTTGTFAIFMDKSALGDLRAFRKAVVDACYPWVDPEQTQVRRFDRESSQWKSLDAMLSTSVKHKKPKTSAFSNEVSQWSDWTAICIKDLHEEPFFRESRTPLTPQTFPSHVDNFDTPIDQYVAALKRAGHRASAGKGSYAYAAGRSSAASGSGKSKSSGIMRIEVDV